ncbi:WecB UDP-N-acetylglucosamine 2-epimerase [Candidatus Pelagibacterales bacterium]
MKYHKKILIITERRADFSRFRPIIDLFHKEKIKYNLIVTGVHLSKKHGFTINEIKAGKYNISSQFEMFDKNFYKKNSGLEMSVAIGKAFIQIPNMVKKFQPDLILSGFDIAANFAITVVGAHMNIPVAHIQGGEVSGTIDESLRHAMSKFAHFHLTANQDSKNRLIKLGEKKNSIKVVGCPSIDALLSAKSLDHNYILKKFKLNINNPFFLILQHPVTTEIDNTKKNIAETLEALKSFKEKKLFIFPNNDAGSKKIITTLKKNKVIYAPTLNLQEYKTLLQKCQILIGNSSSGIHEAASFKKPVVNIGTRQQGRLKPLNVIDAPYNAKKIIQAIKKGLSQKFLKKLDNLRNPYGDGKSAIKIVKFIKNTNFKKTKIQKKITY